MSGTGKNQVVEVKGTETEYVQLATRVPKSVRRDVKLYCLTKHVRLQDFIADALREKLKGKDG